MFEPAGCMYCANRGFVGRIGLFEMLPVDEDMSRWIADGADEGQIAGRIRERRVPRLAEDAMENCSKDRWTFERCSLR